MRPPDDVVRRLAHDWLAKAGTDLKVCERLAGEDGTLADAGELTPYGVEYRYPGEYDPVSAETAAACVVLARIVHDEVVRRMSEGVRQ